jgi:transcriptional regulator with XRE-family HTH domain
MYSFTIIKRLGFGEVLRGHRRAARLTLEQLAEVSGVSARTLSDMERGRSKGPQHRTVTALADALALEGDARKQLVELARDGRLRDHWTRPAGLCELPRLVDDFTGRAAELVWMSELVYAESAPGAGVVGLITGSGGMGKTTLAIRAAHVLRPNFPGGVFFLDLFGMSQRPAAAADALRLLLRALGLADEQIPGDVSGRASVYRSLLRDRHALVVLDNAGSEEQVRPLLPGDGASRALITARRLLAGLEGVRRLVLGPLSLPEATELMTGILGQRAARDEEPALNQLAELCEGMPLALRIIGNRLVSRPGWDAAELAARLADEEHRLDQFKAGDLKIATAFGMSYEQLADAARRVFRRLAVVPGRDFDAALAAVAGEVPVEIAWDALDVLVDLGLLLDSAAGRYRFHDLVRLFARTRLEEEESPAEREALTARVTSWLLRMATMAGRWFEPGYGRPGLPDPDLVVLSCAEEAENWLRANVDNWLGALRSAADRGQHSAVVAQSGAQAQIAGSHQYTARAQLLLGRLDEAAASAFSAAKTFDAIGDIDAYVQCLSLIGLCRRDEGRYAEALEQFRTALALIDDEGSGMTPTIAAQSRPDAHFRIAQCLGALGRRTEAISTLTEAIGLMETLQPNFRQAEALETLAALLAEEGRTEESRRTYARAAQVYEAIGDAEASSRCHAAVTPAP